MKRAQVGDVYAFPTERGYRIMQWAYSVERYGKYIKVFPGFFKEHPQNLDEIIDGDCAYIITVDAPKYYRKGVFELWDNRPVKDPFPLLELEFSVFGKLCYFTIRPSIGRGLDPVSFIGRSDGSDMPKEYRHVRLINLIPHPYSFLHMLLSEFDLQHFNRYISTDEEEAEIVRRYGTILFGEDLKKRF